MDKIDNSHGAYLRTMADLETGRDEREPHQQHDDAVMQLRGQIISAYDQCLRINSDLSLNVAGILLRAFEQSRGL